MDEVGGMAQGPALSVHALEAKNLGKYDFSSISVKSPENHDGGIIEIEI